MNKHSFLNRVGIGKLAVDFIPFRDEKSIRDSLWECQHLLSVKEVSIKLDWHQLEAYQDAPNLYISEEVARRVRAAQEAMRNDVTQLVAALAGLPKLEKVDLEVSRAIQEIRHQTGRAIAGLLNRFPNKVRSLTLSRATVDASFSDFLDTLASQENLQAFHLDQMFLRGDQVSLVLLRTVARLPSLHQFHCSRGHFFISGQSTMHAHAAALASLGRSTRLTSLELGSFFFGANFDALIPLLRALQYPASQLQSLDLGDISGWFNNLYGAAGELLGTNVSLHHLTLPFSHPANEDATVILPIIDALKTNQSLKSLEFIYRRPRMEPPRRLCERIRLALNDVMSNFNYSLEHVQFEGLLNNTDEEDYDLFLRLNRSEEAHLLRNPNHQSTRKDWLKGIIELKDDVAAVYFLLQMNPPWLVNGNSSPAAGQEDGSPSPKRRKVDTSLVGEL